MGRRWPIWLNASALLLASWTTIAALTLRLPANAEIAAVLFPPWWSVQRAMAATASADAAVIRTGIIPTILIVQLAGSDGLQRLRDAGIWLALDPRAVGGCAPQ